MTESVGALFELVESAAADLRAKVGPVTIQWTSHRDRFVIQVTVFCTAPGVDWHENHDELHQWYSRIDLIRPVDTDSADEVIRQSFEQIRKDLNSSLKNSGRVVVGVT